MAPMRTLVLVAAALALLTFLPATAQAQQASSLVITLQPPAEALTADKTLTFVGTVTYTADYTAMLGLTGIPVTYTVSERPEWTSVVVSPSNDVFPLPMGPQPGISYTVTRMISVTVTLAQPLEQDASGAIEITATTQAPMLGQSTSGKGAVPILYDAADEECHELSEAELIAMAREAAEDYAAKNGAVDVPAAAPSTDAGGEELHVQSGGASTLSLPWVAVAGFALVGGGVGLILKRRLGR